MKNRDPRKRRLLTGARNAIALGAALFAASAQADGFFSNFDLAVGGFLRVEGTYSTSSYDNPNNQLSNIFNGREIERQAFVPPTLLQEVAVDLPIVGPIVDLLPIDRPVVDSWTTLPLPALVATDANSPGLRGVDSAAGEGTPFPRIDNDINYAILRGEVEFGLRYGQNWSLIGRLRGIFDPAVYDEFDAQSVAGLRRGIFGGDPALYRGKPNYFEYRVEGDSSPNPLEWTGDDYQVYFPALFLQYNSGPVNLRIGNQQIAWGQALFFRVLDVPNGLDLRRHSLLDYAQEEFSDKRVPSLGIRLGYQITDAVLADAFIQKFQPTVLGNPNTQYNIIPTQFTVHDLYKEGDYDDELSYGLRLKGNHGQWGWQAIAVERFNPDGTFRWTKSNVATPLPNELTTTGQYVNTTLALQGLDSGELLAQTAFEVAPGGVYSANEWFNYAAQVRLNGITGLNASIEEFPATTELYASTVETFEEATNQLNTFFIAAGGSLRGHIAREYHREQVYGLGGSYVTEGEPGSLLDQLIINLEVSYTPDRTFTNTSLSRNYIVEDAWIGALVMEKYHRFTPAFPATYFVLQYMYRDTDDLFGRHLSGYGGSETKVADGISEAHYVALAFQQPFPQDVYRIGFATLYDPRGSILVQPGIKYKPSREWTFEAFYTYLDGDLNGANPNDTLLSTVDFADEVTVRIAYQF